MGHLGYNFYIEFQNEIFFLEVDWFKYKSYAGLPRPVNGEQLVDFLSYLIKKYINSQTLQNNNNGCTSHLNISSYI